MRGLRAPVAPGAAPPPERLEGVHRGPGWFLSWVDGVEVVYMDRRMTPRSLDAYLACVEHLMQTARTPRPCYYDVPEPNCLDAGARRRISDLLSQYRENVARNTLAYALVTPSATVRGILRAIFWMSPPPYQYGIFRSDVEAFEWLAVYAPLDPHATLQHYQRLKRWLMSSLEEDGRSSRSDAVAG